MRLRARKYQLLLALVLIDSVLTIGLRDLAPNTTATELDASSYVTQIDGIGFGGLLWSDNFTGNAWLIALSPNNANAYLQVRHTLNFTAIFQAEQVPQAISISRNLNLSLDENPALVIGLLVSPGVHYGIRFSGVAPSGETFEAWREGSTLEHRPGLGISENIEVNLPAETFLANNRSFVAGSRITRLWIYLEMTSGTGGRFSLELTALQAFSIRKTSSNSQELDGTFYDIMVNMRLPSQNLSLFQGYAAYDISGTAGLSYTPFLIRGGSILAEGYTYTQTLSTHQVAVLLPQLANQFPSILPDQYNSSVIVIVANSGEITHFRLDDLTLRYTATPDLASSGGVVDSTTATWLIAYYFVFLFITPIAAAILLTKVFAK